MPLIIVTDNSILGYNISLLKLLSHILGWVDIRQFHLLSSRSWAYHNKLFAFRDVFPWQVKSPAVNHCKIQKSGKADRENKLIICCLINCIQMHYFCIIFLFFSSGSGRTGVFYALSILVERLRAEGGVDLPKTVRQLREERLQIAETLEEYSFC